MHVFYQTRDILKYPGVSLIKCVHLTICSQKVFSGSQKFESETF